jgi:hypothetical protein
LVAIDRISAYRVEFSLAALILVLLVFAGRTLLAALKPRAWHYALLAVACLGLGLVANRHTWLLLAEPHGNEWELMRAAVIRADFNREQRVRIVMPSLEDRSTNRSYGDEFGSVSSSAEPIARDMFHAALRSRFGERLPKNGRYVLTVAPGEPEAGSFDLLIDLRKLKNFR